MKRVFLSRYGYSCWWSKIVLVVIFPTLDGHFDEISSTWRLLSIGKFSGTIKCYQTWARQIRMIQIMMVHHQTHFLILLARISIHSTPYLPKHITINFSFHLKDTRRQKTPGSLVVGVEIWNFMVCVPPLDVEKLSDCSQIPSAFHTWYFPILCFYLSHVIFSLSSSRSSREICVEHYYI